MNLINQRLLNVKEKILLIQRSLRGLPRLGWAPHLPTESNHSTELEPPLFPQSSDSIFHSSSHSLMKNSARKDKKGSHNLLFRWNYWQITFFLEFKVAFIREWRQPHIALLHVISLILEIFSGETRRGFV